MTFREDLAVIGRALMFLAGAGVPGFIALLLCPLLVLFQNWQGVMFVAAFASEAMIFGKWISGRLTRPWLAGLASGALALEVGFVAVTLTNHLPVRADEFVEWLTGLLLVIALCHGFASWKLFATARMPGWRHAIGAFLTGATGLAAVVYTLFALLPPTSND